MTREELIEIIYTNNDDYSCPENYKCKLTDDEKYEGGCERCAEKQLTKYELNICREFAYKLTNRIIYNIKDGKSIINGIELNKVIDSILMEMMQNLN